MEGIVDWQMRDTLTAIRAFDFPSTNQSGTDLPSIDHCVTEFLRVTDQLLPPSVFYRNCPELNTNSKTRSGVPVFLQLLGSVPEAMAANAIRAVELGAAGIDLNFGCPAKLVNRNCGGAVLLKTPEKIFDVVNAVRKAVPTSIPVTAKIRLGYDDPNQCFENAKAIEEAGAEWLTVHCRTKVNGYTPPAYWEWIPRIKEKVTIKIIANGEIWNVEDFKRCQKETSCEEFMIGRGAISNPFIFSEIKNSLQQNCEQSTLTPWINIKQILPGFFEGSSIYVSEDYAVAKTKCWLKYLSRNYLEAAEIFDKIKIYREKEFLNHLYKNLDL